MSEKIGCVIWITGLSGVGKTSLAEKIVLIFKDQGLSPYHIDGDDIREILNDEACGYDYKSRLKNAYRICKLAQHAAEQDQIVIVSTMSLFHEIHLWNRKYLKNYYEVFIDIPIDNIRKIDSKKLYSIGVNLPGVDITPELPANPHLKIENRNFKLSIDDISNIFFREYKKTKY